MQLPLKYHNILYMQAYICDCLCENPPCSHILHSSHSNYCKMPIVLPVLKCCTPKCTQMIQPLMSKLLWHSTEWLHHYEVSNFKNKPKFAFKHGGFSQGQFTHYNNIANLENSLCSTWHGPEWLYMQLQLASFLNYKEYI